eukprot:CAMPEP_0198259460 /NCGR_PEP_ID=MMETSP1447-20131203/8645_1 /TAXON_ID=420782 /ORGANISM="Chaetoceros dichaeta, Strain CCMP1751" /LENGTH=751 /DNA_ID=CAMNT_0043946851 /DNA_START=293 /DNA_END=2548 /DNA_ORIENTATION=+
MTTPQEIWSVRLQREIIALTDTAPAPAPAPAPSSDETNDNVPANDDAQRTTDDESSPETPATPDASSTADNSAKNVNSTIGMLPPFISVQKHMMEIENGICQVWFDVEVTSIVSEDEPKKGTVAQEEKPKTDDIAAIVDEIVNASEQSPDAPPATASVPTEGQEEKIAPPSTPLVVTIILDASLPQQYNPTTSSPSRKRPIFDTVMCYPFSKPIATLSSGAIHLPTGSTLQDGDKMDIDCDWTPSLHLRDAAVNVALKLREGIKRNEPIYKNDEDEFRMMGEALSQGVSQGTQKMKSFFLSVRDKAAAVADELDKAVAAERADKEERLIKQQQKQQVVMRKTRLLAAKKKKELAAAEASSKVVDGTNVQIGDVINLAMNPWNKAVGMHSCKAIRRPGFVDTAIKLAATDGDGRNRNEVAGAGVLATGSIFQSFRQSAKSLVEESYLMLTPDHILEISCNKFSVATATVTYAIPVSSLSKLKFRREESISLFFRQAPDDPAIYMCASSAEAVKELQGVLKKYGVRGKHTNATMQRCVKSAIVMIDEIQAREIELEEAGVSEGRRVMVEKIMDLYRQAAEQFELAGDVRHEEVMVHMHEFLAKPLVAEILDGQSVRGSGESKKEAEAEAEAEPEPVPDGEILESHETENDNDGSSQVEPDDEGDDVDESNEQDSDEFQRAMQAAESMLKDAHDDLKDLGIDDDLHVEEDIDDEFGLGGLSVDDSIGDDGNDVVSEFEDMLKDADKELAELMGS